MLIENDKFGWQFFPPEVARSPTPTILPAVKAPGTFRVFVFGESAALGDPRPAYGFGRFLEVLLNERFPGRRFEVVCNYRLARALADQVETLLPSASITERRSEWLDAEACARRLGLTDWNRFAVIESVLQRLQDAPFTNQPGNPSRLRALQAELVRLKTEMQPRNFLDARAIYDEALAIVPEDFRLHENYAEFLEATEEFAEARDHFAEVVRLRPDFALGHLNYGVALAKLGQVREAHGHFRATLKLDPGNAKAAEYLRLLESAAQPAAPPP